MKKRPLLFIMIGLIVFVACLIFIPAIIKNIDRATTLSAKDLKPGTPDYAIQEVNYNAGMMDRKYKYIILDNYMFVISSSPQTNNKILSGSAIIGAKDKNGNYVFSSPQTNSNILSGSALVGVRDKNGNYTLNMGNIPFALVNPHDSDWEYVSGIVAYKYNGQIAILFSSNQKNDPINFMIDNSALKLIDQAGNELGKLSIDGTDFVAFYDVMDTLPNDLAIYAVYNGQKVLMTNADELYTAFKDWNLK